MQLFSFSFKEGMQKVPASEAECRDVERRQTLDKFSQVLRDMMVIAFRV